jgi:hypothetical protein
MSPRQGPKTRSTGRQRLQQQAQGRRSSVKDGFTPASDSHADVATDGDSSASWNGSYASLGSAASTKTPGTVESTFTSLLDPACVLASESEALAECIDSLTDKRRWLREAALRRARRLTDSGLRRDLWNETLLEQFIEQALRGPLRRGSLVERGEVCRLIGTSMLTLVAITDQTETLETLLQRTRLETQLLQLATATAPAAVPDPEWIQWQECLIETVCLVRFLTAADTVAVAEMMQKLEQYFLIDACSRHVPGKNQHWANDQVVACAIRGWALLASALPPGQVWLQLRHRPIRQSLETWATQDDWKKTSTFRETCLAATEAMALLLERCHGIETDDWREQFDSDQVAADTGSEPPYSSADSDASVEASDHLANASFAGTDEWMDSDADTPQEPSPSSSNGMAELGKALERVASTATRHRYRLGKRNRSLLRLVARSATQRVGADTMSIRQQRRKERLEAQTWSQRRQLDAFRRACGRALAAQLEGNTFLRDLFGLHGTGAGTPGAPEASSSDPEHSDVPGSGVDTPRRNRRPGTHPEQVRRQARQKARRQKQQQQQGLGLES